MYYIVKKLMKGQIEKRYRSIDTYMGYGPYDIYQKKLGDKTKMIKRSSSLASIALNIISFESKF